MSIKLFSKVGDIPAALAFAFPVIEAKETPKLWEIIKKIFDLFSLPGAAAQISPLLPLPDLTASPGAKLQQLIDLKAYYALSDPNNNLDLSIDPQPDWLSMQMGSLQMLKTYDVGATIFSVCGSGPYAYAALYNGISIVNLTNPTAPTVAGSKTIGNYPADTSSRFIAINDNYVFHCNSTKIHVFDVSDKSNIVLTNSISNGYYNDAMSLDGNYLYTIQCFLNYTNLDGSAYLTIIDVSNPLNPVIKPPFFLWQRYYCQSSSSPLYISGNYAFIERTIIDITNLDSPSIVPASLVGMPFAIQGDHLFASTGLDVQVYDISQISNPQLLSAQFIGGTNYITKFILEGKHLYASGRYGIQVINIEEVLNPLLEGTFTSLGPIYDAYLCGNRVIAAYGEFGLAIIDASKRVLSGTPLSSDRGLWKINVTAADSEGHAVTQPVAIHVGNVNFPPIPDQQLFCGNRSSLSVAFDYPGAPFTYTAQLPPFISLDSNTFTFTPKSGDQNRYTIVVTANDGYQDTTTSFNVIVLNRAPVVTQLFTNHTAYSLQPFEFLFGNRTFVDPDNDTLTYSAQLPSWLNFDSSARRFYGTPYGKGFYLVQAMADDGYGGRAANPFAIAVPSSAPIVLNPPAAQLASAGIPFSYTFNTKTFYDVDNDPLTYSAELLPGFLNFNPANRTFSGTPQIQDKGTHSIALSAQDPTGEGVSTSFSLSVLSSEPDNNPPVVMKSIPDTTVYAGAYFNYTIDPKTFFDPEGSALTYQAVLEGGTPLPAGLTFDALTLFGTVEDPQTLRISIRASDPAGAFALNTFALHIVDHTSYPPAVARPLPDVVATVGGLFNFRIPADTFASPNKLTISIHQKLPQWLKWDPAALSLSGKPGSWDTGTFQDNIIDMDVWATDGLGSAKASFRIFVQGVSFWEKFIKAGISITSVAASGYGVWQNRARIWNYFRKEQKETVSAIVGEDFERELRLKFHELKEIQVFYAGKPVARLPDGLFYRNDRIKGVPKEAGLYTIRIFDHGGYINEEFNLIINAPASTHYY